MSRARDPRDIDPPGRSADRTSAAEVFDPESGAQVVRAARIVREALEGYASAESVDEMLERALASAALLAPPRTARELDAFVVEHLAPIVEARLGAAAVDALRARLAPTIQAMARMEPPPRSSPSTLPPPAGSASVTAEEPRFAAIVLAGSPQDAARIAQRIGIAVQRTADVGAFAAAIDGCGSAPAMVVIDCRFANPIAQAGLRVLAPGTLEGAVVALWGGNAMVEREWRRRFPGAVVLRTDVASDVEDIAVLIKLGPD